MSVPQEIEQAISHVEFIVRYEEDVDEFVQSLDQLRQAIRTALAERDQALVERAERLRRQIMYGELVKPGDLADDLVPAQDEGGGAK